MLVKVAMEKAGLPVTYKHLERKMRENLQRMKYPTLYEMLKRLKQSNLLKIYACSPSMEMFEIQRKDLIPEGEQIVGSATFLEIAAKADVTFFI